MLIAFASTIAGIRIGHKLAFQVGFYRSVSRFARSDSDKLFFRLVTKQVKHVSCAGPVSIRRPRNEEMATQW